MKKPLSVSAKVAPLINGGGGGKPDQAQAGGSAPENIDSALAAARDGDTLVRELLEIHYDPAYTRSTLKHYPYYAQGMQLAVTADSDAAFGELAARCLKAVSPHASRVL